MFDTGFEFVDWVVVVLFRVWATMAPNTTEIMMANRIMADIFLFTFIVASILDAYLFASLFKTC